MCVHDKIHVHTHTNYIQTVLYQRYACTYQKWVTVTDKFLSIKYSCIFFLKSITDIDILMYVGNEIHTSDPCILIINLRTWCRLNGTWKIIQSKSREIGFVLIYGAQSFWNAVHALWNILYDLTTEMDVKRDFGRSASNDWHQLMYIYMYRSISYFSSALFSRLQ